MRMIFWLVMGTILFAPFAFCVLASYRWWLDTARFRNYRSIAAIAGVIFAAAGIIVMWAAFRHQWLYGFEFNDPSVRVAFMRAGSRLSTIAIVLAFAASKQIRGSLLIASLLPQLYWMEQGMEI